MITTSSAGAVENRSISMARPISGRTALRRVLMKRGVLARSRALDLEQPTGSDRDVAPDVAIVDWDAGPPRQGSDRFGIDRLPLRRGSRHRRHPGRRRGRDPSRCVDRRLASRRPRRPAGRAARQQLPAPHRRLSLPPLQRSRRRDRPGAARLAADAGHAVRRRLLLRSDHRHQRPVDRPVVLPGGGIDRGEPHHAQSPGQELAACRPSWRARRRHRLRPDGPAAAARPEFRFGWSAHPGRLRR